MLAGCAGCAGAVRGLSRHGAVTSDPGDGAGVCGAGGAAGERSRGCPGQSPGRGGREGLPGRPRCSEGTGAGGGAAASQKRVSLGRAWRSPGPREGCSPREGLRAFPCSPVGTAGVSSDPSTGHDRDRRPCHLNPSARLRNTSCSSRYGKGLVLTGAESFLLQREALKLSTCRTGPKKEEGRSAYKCVCPAELRAGAAAACAGHVSLGRALRGRAVSAAVVPAPGGAVRAGPAGAEARSWGRSAQPGSAAESLGSVLASEILEPMSTVYKARK